MARNYSNIAVDTTLTAGINAAVGSCVVASATGWPAAPFAAVLDPGLVTEEVVEVTVKVGTTFTITRGFDGTAAAAHALGAVVRHAAIASDFTDLQAADTAEAGTRAAADSALNSAISSEATTRASADSALSTAISNEAIARSNADALRLLIANYDWSTLPNKPAFGSLALLNSITASLISDASANGQSLIMAANYAAMRTLLGLVVGTDVQAQNANLAALAGLTLAADRSVYSTGAGALALYTLSSFARTILDDADATTMRATLGLLALATKNTIATADIDNDAVTYAKMQNVSATARILGRTTAGAGDVEELTGAQALSITGAAQAIQMGRLVESGVTHLAMLGVSVVSVSTQAINTNKDRYCPFVVYTTITLDQLAIEITSAGAGGTTVRLGIYNVDSSGVPGSLVIDAGTVAADSLGFKAASISQQLTPGRYYFVFNSDGTPTLRFVRGTPPHGVINSALGASPSLLTMSGNRAYGAFPGTGTVVGTTTFGSVPFENYVFPRISVP